MGPQFSYGYRAADMVKAAGVFGAEFYPVGVRLLCMAAGIGPILVGIGLGFVAAVAMNNDWAPASIFAGIVLGWCVARPLSARVSEWAAARISSAKAVEDAPVRFEFGEDSLRVLMPGNEAVWRWDAIHHAFENDGAIYLVVGMSGVVISSRAFATPQERRSAMEWIWARLPPDARSRSRSGSASKSN